MFIRSEYAANLSFIAGKSVIPPAKKVARPEANFVASFVFDAVGTDVSMPATAEKVWKALKKNGSKKAAA